MSYTLTSSPPATISPGVASSTSSAPGGLAPDRGQFWAPVRVASTQNLSSLSALGAIDGIILAIGDRVLLKDQSTAANNGIYAVQATGTEKVAGSQTFADTVTPITITGLTAGVLYSWTKGTNTARLVNGSQTLTASATFIASGTSITLYGSSAASVTDSIKACDLARASDAGTSTLTAGRSVAVRQGAVGAGIWVCTGGTYTFARPASPATITP